MDAPLAFVLSSLVSILGYRRGALTLRGALAAVWVGFAVLRGLGWTGGLILGFFFASGSVLSRRFERGNELMDANARRAVQVLANGAVPTVLAMSGSDGSSATRFAGFAGAFAAATADTWATAVGATSPTPPRMLLSGETVEPGVSGGVTMRGSVASTAGALAIGILSGAATRDRLVGSAVTLAGVSGSIIDSILGETVQERRWSAAEHRVVERSQAPSANDKRVSGLPYFNNDAVNLACTLCGALTAIGLVMLGRRG